MILVDTGPLVALFDPKDADHHRCQNTLETISQPIFTTIPVLTEAFHLLNPDSIGSQNLVSFVSQGGAGIWFLSDSSLQRAFELMDKYRDQTMDLADASLVVAAERLNTRSVFSIDRRDFNTYRLKRGHQNLSFKIIP